MKHAEIAELAKPYHDDILAAVERGGLEDPGFCIKCGAEAFQVEPDAREYPCESCDERAVFGAEELIFYLEI